MSHASATKLIGSRVTFVIFVSILVCWCLGTAYGDVLSSDKKRIVEELASAITAPPDRTIQILEEMGFDTLEARFSYDGYEWWPSLRKIELAYFAAEEAQGGGGELFLRKMSRIIATDHSRAVSFDPVLKPYFADGSTDPGDRKAVAFRIPSTLPSTSPPPEMRAAILAIEPHVSRLPGGAAALMQVCCNLSPDKIYEILRHADRTGSALWRAIEIGEVPPEAIERFNRLLERILETSRAMALDPALKSSADRSSPERAMEKPPAAAQKAYETAEEAIKKAQKLDDDPLAPSAQSVVPGGGPGGSGPSGNAKRFQDVTNSAQPTWSRDPGKGPVTNTTPPWRPSFSTMRSSPRGFGGVLFGNKISLGTDKFPRIVTWVPDLPETASGRFDVVFENGDIVHTRSMRSDDAALAFELVLKSDPPLGTDESQAIGLGSVTSFTSDDVRFPFVLNPVLYGTDIGTDILLADVLQEVPPEIYLVALSKADVPTEATISAVAWFSGNWGFYKITDAPLTVVVRDGLLTVERTQDGNRFKDSLRSEAFLAFQACPPEIDGVLPCDLPESATTFYEALPALMASFPEFARLNRFAETMAILRWAHAAKVEVDAPKRPEAHEQPFFVYWDKGASLRLVTASEWIALKCGDTPEGDRNACYSSRAVELILGSDLDVEAKSEAMLEFMRNTLVEPPKTPDAKMNLPE
jgi:hypothetical protein